MPAPLEPGAVLAGKFRIERVLGRGGMGVVVAARHLELDERVAIKFLLPEALGNADAVTRFAREARAAVKIKSEHVARVTDVGRLDDGGPYIVMEFLEGHDLSTVMATKGKLAVDEAVDYILQASEAIAEAHALGIVHRDLKPANLFLVRRADGSPCVKVLDFGISKMVDPNGFSPTSLTKSSVIIGSPSYMSPEQLTSSRDVDSRTDVWGLGTILYEFVTGVPPFVAPNYADLCMKVLTSHPTPPTVLTPSVPADLQRVILSALERDRGRRLQSVAELANRIAPFGPQSARVSANRIAKVLGPPSTASRREKAASFKGTASIPPQAIEKALENVARQRDLEAHREMNRTATIGIPGDSAPTGQSAEKRASGEGWMSRLVRRLSGKASK